MATRPRISTHTPVGIIPHRSPAVQAPAAAGWRWDVTNDILELSPEWFAMLGYEDGEVETDPMIWWRWMHPDDRRLTSASLRVLLSDPVSEGRTIAFRMQHKQGHWVDVICRGVQMHDAQDRTTLFEGTMIDVSALSLAHEQLQDATTAAERARMMLESASRLARLGRWEVHLDGRRPHWTPMMYEIHELPTSVELTLELTGSFYDAAYRADVEGAIARSVTELTAFEFEVPIVTHLGRRKWVSARGEPVVGPDGGIVSLRGALRDTTEERQLRDRLEHQASRDALTGLVNRSCFLSMVDTALERCEDDGQYPAVLMIDLNQFKEINDTMGHDAGDEFLCEVADRLRQLVGDRDILARLGGDEFAVFSRGELGPDTADTLAHRLWHGLRQPFWPQGVQYFCSGSIGIASSPRDGTTPQELLRHADIAMYAAKDDPLQGVRHYDPSMTTKASVQLERRVQLERAVREQQFQMQYQPRVCLQSMQTVAVEALSRWRDQTGTMIAPSSFIALAERTGMIHPIGEWVIRRTITDTAELIRRGHAQVRMAINLSPRQFRHPSLVDIIEDALTTSGVSPQSIEVEITESLLLEENHLTQPHLRRLNALGVRIALDDFGTGYSSFAHLQELQVETIKLDQRFVTGVENNPRNARLVEAMLSMASSLGIRTVAEGVESEGTADFLRDRGCDEIQGFLIAPAMDLDDVIPLLGRIELPSPWRR